MQNGTNPSITPGLEGVIAAETRLSSVNGQIGELMFLSPCVLPLVPAYLGYLSGHTLQKD